MLNRRKFIADTAKTTAVAALGYEAVTQAAEKVSASAQPLIIIDTHTHFYDPSRPQGVPWPGRNDKVLYRRVLPADYHAQPVPQPVTGTVVVEASPWIEDNQWILDLAAKEPFIVGFVGNLPAGAKEFEPNLKRFAANQLFRGIRLPAAKVENGIDDLAFQGDMRLLAEHDLSLDLLGGVEVLGTAARLSDSVPGLRLVVDHLANVQIDGKAPPADWVKQMRALGKKPNVYFKLSALVEGTGRSDGSAPKDVEFYRPVLDTMVQLFGPERLMYGSNWPVSERFAPLSTVQGIVQNYCHTLGRRVEEQIFWKTAKAAYKWVERKK